MATTQRARRSRGPVRASLGGLAVTALAAALVGCGSGAATAPDTAGTGESTARCPVTPLRITVSVDPWSDIVTRLAGACGEVSTILAGSAGDPHDYEPTPGDAAAMNGAQLVVVNGAGYDTWASKLAETVSPAPAIVDAGIVVGAAEGANPHLWYSPTSVHQVAAAVTAELTGLAPDAATYFADAATDWTRAMAPYDEQVASLRTSAARHTYGATEGVFDLMAQHLGMVDATPPGWRNAAANESDPSPGDILAFQQALGGGAMDLLVVNRQTAGSAPDAVRSVAESAGVPVVEVTETMPDGADSFVEWQVGQLQQVAQALDA